MNCRMIKAKLAKEMPPTNVQKGMTHQGAAFQRSNLLVDGKTFCHKFDDIQWKGWEAGRKRGHVCVRVIVLSLGLSSKTK